jgi:hypothetical protein
VAWESAAELERLEQAAESEWVAMGRWDKLAAHRRHSKHQGREHRSK